MKNEYNKASRGSIIQIILSALSSGDKYGYEIIKEIEKLSSGLLILKQPSLYSSLRRMEEQNLISSYWTDSDLGGKRHYYSLTTKGKDMFNNECKDLKIEELIQNLPLNEVQEEKTNTKFSENFTTTVANQENLFNLARKKDDIKLIDETIKQEENSQSYFQFDLFDENINLVKDNIKNDDNLKQYTNKYVEYDNKQEEIEPIKRESVFKNSITNFQPQKNDLLINHSIEKKEDNILHELNEIKFDINQSAKINETPKQDNETVYNNSNDIKQEIINSDTLTDKKNDTSLDSLDNIDNIEDSSFNHSGVISNDKPTQFDSYEYKNIIAKLYNDSKLEDPYEKNKYKSFKEIFPYTKLSNINNSAKHKESEIKEFIQDNSNLSGEDINVLKNTFAKQNLTIKVHSNLNNEKNLKEYTDINKLNMITSWILCLIMILEFSLLYYILINSTNYIFGKIMYYIATILIISIFSIFTLENLFDRYKLIIIKKNFKDVFIKSLLVFIVLSIILFAICLMFGMQSLLQLEFINYWAIPFLILLNIIFYPIIFFGLLKTKKFNN